MPQPINVYHKSSASRRCFKLAHDLSGWNASILSQEPQSFSGSLVSTGLGGLTISRLEIDGDTLATFLPESGRTGFVLVRSMASDTLFAGYQPMNRLLWHGLGHNTLTLRSSDRLTLHLVTWQSVTSPFQSAYHLRTTSKGKLDVPDIGRVCCPDQASALCSLVDQVLEPGNQDMQDWVYESAEQIVNAVSTKLIDALDTADDGEISPAISLKNLSLFVAAHRYVEQSTIRKIPTPSVVAGAVGVHARTLQAAFQESVGMTPKQFSRLVQLHRIRHDIEESITPAPTVMAIAAMAGFSSPSHFSASFKRLFGDSPSNLLVEGE